MYLLAQGFGILGTLVTIVQPLLKTKVQLSLCSGLINLLSGLNYALLGQTGSSMLLCLVAVVQAAVSVFEEMHGRSPHPGQSGAFGCLYVAAGLLGLATGGNGVSLPDILPILGALMLMCSISAKSAQRTRLFLFLNALFWLLYTGLLGSTVFFSCLVSLLSSGFALWKYRAK